jgi:hypothetical protein
MEKINHSFDLSLNRVDDVENLSRASYFAATEEKVDDGSFDCAGTVGSAGTLGGTFGTFGTFGCCC